MKTKSISILLLAALTLLQAGHPAVAQQNPPLTVAPPRPAAAETFVYEQKPVVTPPLLIPPQQAQAIVEHFRAAYQKLGNPRILIYVNRELVDEQSGMKLAARTERTGSVRGSGSDEFLPDPKALLGTNAAPSNVTIKAGGDITIAGTLNTGAGQRQPGKGKETYQRDVQVNDNTYQIRERRSLGLEDKRREREIEMAFGRPLRAGGATVVDQRIATQLIGDRHLKSFTVPTEGEQARKDREAIGKIADVVLEVLISAKEIMAREVSGDRPMVVFIAEATAISLKDSRVLAQSSSQDLLGPQRRIESNRLYPRAGPAEIAEATALLLMDNLITTVGR